jgi:hypothetical protein
VINKVSATEKKTEDFKMALTWQKYTSGNKQTNKGLESAQ